MTLGEARTALIAELASYEETALKNSSSLRDSLLRDVKVLRSTLNALTAAEVPEPRAVASKTIKDGFTQRALGALDRANVPEWTNVTNVLSGLAEVERALGTLSVGQREVIHLHFFFKEQLAELASQLRVTFDVITHVRSRLVQVAEKRKEVEAIFGEHDGLTADIERKLSEIKQVESEARDARNSISGVEMLDTSRLERLRAELAQARRDITVIDQHVASGLSPAVRLLKRYGHISAEKPIAAFVEKLEQNPADAFYEYGDVAKAAIAGSIAAVKTGEINSDEKELRRAEIVLSKFDDLFTLKEKRNQLSSKASGLDISVDAETSKERENAKAAGKVDSLERTIARNEVRAVELKREIGEAEQRLAVLKRMIGEQAAEMLGENVTIA